MRRKYRPMAFMAVAAVAQLVERILGKDEVMGPIPISSLQDREVSVVKM